MAKIYGVNSFVMETGERYCLVVDRAKGLPEYYPNLYLTTQIRNRSDAFSTMEAAAGGLVVLLRFLERRSIDLEQRLLAKNFFKPHELDDLRDFAQRKLSKLPSTVPATSMFSFEELEGSVDTVNNMTLYSRLTTIDSQVPQLVCQAPVG